MFFSGGGKQRRFDQPAGHGGVGGENRIVRRCGVTEAGRQIDGEPDFGERAGVGPMENRGERRTQRRGKLVAEQTVEREVEGFRQRGFGGGGVAPAVQTRALTEQILQSPSGGRGEFFLCDRQQHSDGGAGFFAKQFGGQQRVGGVVPLARQHQNGAERAGTDFGEKLLCVSGNFLCRPRHENRLVVRRIGEEIFLKRHRFRARKHGHGAGDGKLFGHGENW